jgi:hypothetical protein
MTSTTCSSVGFSKNNNSGSMHLVRVERRLEHSAQFVACELSVELVQAPQR